MADAIDPLITALIHAYEHFAAVADMRPPEDASVIAAKEAALAAKQALIVRCIAAERLRCIDILRGARGPIDATAVISFIERGASAEEVNEARARFGAFGA